MLFRRLVDLVDLDMSYVRAEAVKVRTVYVCMHVYMYVYMYVYMCACIYARRVSSNYSNF